jgi:hypothetical protein
VSLACTVVRATRCDSDPNAEEMDGSKAEEELKSAECQPPRRQEDRSIAHGYCDGIVHAAATEVTWRLPHHHHTITDRASRRPPAAVQRVVVVVVVVVQCMSNGARAGFAMTVVYCSIQ